MNLLVSGATGLLGSAFIKLATARDHVCTPLNRDQVRLSLTASAEAGLDLLFKNIDYFVHAAANTNVDRCEVEPSQCHRDNVLLTELLASAARRCGVSMAFISSTGVYGNLKETPYAEYDDTQPRTQHHRSKLRAEQLVLAADWSNLVVRTGWLFGGNAMAPKNFVARRILEARTTQNGVISSNLQQHGCPTLVDDLAARILALIELKSRGIFNVVNEGTASRFEYVREILSLAGVPVEVRAVLAGEFNRIAPVSNNEMAVNWRANELGFPLMRPWQMALADYLATEDMRVLTE